MRYKSKKILPLFFTAVCLFACGCGTVLESVMKSIEVHGKGKIIDGVPDVVESGGGWAAAALEAVYKFHDRDISQKVISRRIYNYRTGHATVELIVRDVELNGMEAVQTTFAGMFDYLRSDFPVLMPARVGSMLPDAPPWLIVIGYDDVTEFVLCAAGKETAVISYEEFKRIVKMNSGELFIIAPPGKMPAAVYSYDAKRAAHRGDCLEAVRLLNMAIERETEAAVRAGYYIRISHAQATLGNNEAAVEACRKAVEVQPDEGDNWHELALAVNLDAGNLAEAKPLLERAIAVSPEKSPYYHAELGRMYFESGDLPAARAAYEKAVGAGIPEGAPPDYEATLLIRLAEVVEEQGYPQLGRNYREKAFRK